MVYGILVAIIGGVRIPPCFLVLHIWCLTVMVKQLKFSSFFLGLVLSLVCARTSSAQWSMNYAFPSQVRSVYFLDQQGSSATGFVGLTNGEIYRTTNNGVSWQAMTTPSAGYQITQFTFKNASQGWCSVRATSGGVWTTTDGGLTWTALTSPVGQMVSIGYNAVSGELVVVNWSAQSLQSSNLGATWTNFSPTQHDGVTFSGNNGVLSVLTASPGFLHSTDGGVTWTQPSPQLHVECWSPYGVPGSNMFYAVAEHLGYVFRSADAGASWSNPYNFPSTVGLTGCVMGTNAALFIQTAANGFFFSTDQGTTWFPICGPSNNFDTRFYSKGKEIFAGDASNNLWYNADGTQTSLSAVVLDKKLFTYTGARCRTYDSVLHITYGSACSGAYLVKAQILFGGAAFSVENLSLPRYISGKDSIQIIYSPTLAARDTGQLLLEFNNGSRLVDTIISLSGVGQTTVSFNHDASIAMTTPYACFSKDSALIIRNLSCDTLTLTSALISDSSIFHILPPGLPRKIAPGDSVSIPILTDALHDGDYNAMVRLHMIGGTSVQVNDSVPVSLSVKQGAQPSFLGLQVALLNRCVTLDTSYTIKNSNCDSIILIRASLTDTSVFKLGSLALSHTIHASESFQLPIHIVSQPKGTYTTQLKLRYLSGQKLVDTTLTLSLQVLSDVAMRPEVSDTALDMGAVNVPCSATARTFTIHNRACLSLSIRNIVWDPADSQYWLEPVSFPITLSTDSLRSFLVHFKPGSATASQAALRVTMDLDGRLVDTLISVKGLGISTFQDTLLTPVLRFDTILACQSQDIEGTLVNLSCDSIIATGARFNGAFGYSVTSPKFPQKLGSGDTLHVHFHHQPGITGEVKDSATVDVYNPVDGKSYPKAISISGYVIPISRRVTLSATVLSLPTLAPCSTADSGFWIHNFGNCEDVVIDSAFVAGFAGVTLTPPLNLPVTIHPGDSIHVAFHVVPDNNLAQRSQIVLRGQNIDTTYSLNYQVKGSAHAMNFTDNGGAFVTRPCLATSKTYIIESTGCDSLTVDNISISGPANQTQFQFKTPRTFPYKIGPGKSDTITIIYQPDGVGNNGANLVVNSGEVSFLKIIPLTGSTPSGGVPTARVAMATSALTHADSAMAGGTMSVLVHSVDGIGDTVNFSTVSFEVHYNWNLLTKRAVLVPAGWSVLDSTEHTNGVLTIKLKHDAGGAVPAATLLATCYFDASIGDSTYCTISIQNLQFNSGDPNYARCMLQSVLVSDTVHFSAIDICNNTLLRDYLDDRLQLTNISIRPNPISLADGAAHADLTFSLYVTADMTVLVRDMLGREVTRTTASYQKGTNTLHLVLPHATEGTYFAEVASGRERVVRKVMVEGR